MWTKCLLWVIHPGAYWAVSALADVLRRVPLALNGPALNFLPLERHPFNLQHTQRP